MQEIYNNKYPNDFDSEIDIKELIDALFHEKKIIFSVTAFISIIGVIYSLLLPNIYQSKAVLVPVSPSSSISSALKSYSSLAGLGGFNLPSSVDEGNTVKAYKKLTSLSFFENNILPNIFLPNLIAVKSWNSDKNQLVYDESIYNKTTNDWVRSYSYPQKQIPSAQESFEVFINEHLSLSEDTGTGFITLKIKHQSPFVAKTWTDLLINEVNIFYRQKDKLQSAKAVSYLNEQIAMTNLSEIKLVLAELLQQETQKLTLIEANESYVFEYIDPPAVMEEKSEPKRALICILVAILGGIFSISFVLIKHYFYKIKAS